MLDIALPGDVYRGD